MLISFIFEGRLFKNDKRAIPIAYNPTKQDKQGFTPVAYNLTKQGLLSALSALLDHFLQKVVLLHSN